jgi:signal peptidase
MGATLSLLVVLVLPHLLGLVQGQAFVVRGSSMEPAVPLGSVAIVRPGDTATVAVGDVVTFHAPNGTVVTHRVVGVETTDGLSFSTKGDASPAADPTSSAASAIVGRVEYVVPILGFILAALGTTQGMVATLGLLGGLLLAIWFIDELIASVRGPARDRRAVAEPAR